ncbi:chromate transporter [Ammoniphilus sp. YIM 78166]|uniref:chromate transporter n=1 Tax=Ammoniphilus sp. YIM 78166 TaxID=1644106 RepID=UPI00106F3482|nr:chromate transporter [Ammoniphilus sp. YIM 78166]
MNKDWKLIWDIFITFLKIGPVTFGGGYAMIPLIEREVVVRREWLKVHEVTDIFAVAESVPGAIAINSATFIGYRIAGLRGAIAAMAGIMLPTFLIVIALGVSFLYFKDNPKMKAAFEGIRPAIVALIAYAGYKLGKIAVIDKTTFVLTGITVLVLLSIHFHPVLIIVSGAVIGIGLVKLKDKLGYATPIEAEEQNDGIPSDYFLGAGI